MILYEFEVRRLLELEGVPLEDACVAANTDELDQCLSRISPPYVVKAQVRGWGRGKAGLVRVAETRGEAREYATRFLGSTYGGQPIRYVMVSEYVPHGDEYYMSLMLDGATRSILLLASRTGGVEVERGGAMKVRVSMLSGLKPYMSRLVGYYLGIPGRQVEAFLEKAYRVFVQYRLHLLELNPLVVVDGELLPIDRKAIVDDDAIRFSDILGEFWERYLSELPPVQREAVEAGINLVLLRGEVGVIGNGAGLTMATMDLVESMGGRPGVFLDIGGGAAAGRVKRSLNLVSRVEGIRSIVVNILGGITRCDEVAVGIVEAVREIPGLLERLHVRMAGLNEEEGRRILVENGVKVYTDPITAVREAVRYANTG